MGINRIIVPPLAGAFSALGIMNAAVRFDYIQTLLAPLEVALQQIPEVVETFKADLREKVRDKSQDVMTRVSVDMRYKGQGHEIIIPFSNELEQAFRERHQALFGFSMLGDPVEVVNAKMVAELPAGELPLTKHRAQKLNVRTTRDVYPDKGVPVYRCDFFGATITGPAVVEDDTATIYLPLGWKGELDLFGILNLERDRS